MKQLEFQDRLLTAEDWTSVRKFFEMQLWECENFDVDTMDDPCIFSNYSGDWNKDEPGMYVMIPSDVYDILYELTMTVGTLRREGPLCDPTIFTDKYDPTRDELYFPIQDIARATYGLLMLPTLYVIVRNVIDFILKKVKLDNYPLLDFSKTTQDAAVRTFFTSLKDTHGSIGVYETCIDLPQPHDFLLLLKKRLKI